MMVFRLENGSLDNSLITVRAFLLKEILLLEFYSKVRHFNNSSDVYKIVLKII